MAEGIAGETKNASELGIRLATESDLPSLTDIYNQAILETEATSHLEPRSIHERKQWWLDHQPERHPILVAIKDNAIIGYAALSPWRKGVVYDDAAEVSVYIDSKSRAAGIGNALMQAILQEGAKRGLQEVVALVWAQNGPSLRMCERCGFERVGVLRSIGRRHGRTMDCSILQMHLR